jgi:CNT family concentrative nucleoside transporter
MTTLLTISFLSILRGLLGMLTLLAIAWLFSINKKKIDWKLVGKGLLIQLIFAVLVLKVPFVEAGFEWISKIFTKVIGFTQEGTMFLFGSFISGEIESSLVNFVVMVLPTIVFFSALTSLFYYWGILQKIVYGFAWVMKKAMNLSGAESLAAAGNIFLGQTEAPLLVKPYLNKMTNSELMCLMSGGMATIAGGVLAAYIGFLGGDDPVQQIYFAKHLLAASVMSAPAAVVAAKILVPETEEFDKKLEISKEKMGSNALEAIANGTTDGIRLAVNVGGMLLVFIALMAMGNYILFKIGDWTAINELIIAHTTFDGLSFQFVLGYLFSPIAWLMGVCSEDMVLVGQLLGEKTILNEFVAYVSLGDMKNTGKFAEEKSVIMATYILCGFANFASIGIQIGGIGSLAPGRKATLAKYGFRALIGGTLASLFTAVIVGMLL